MADHKGNKSTDPTAVWANMLNSIYRISEGMAESIVEVYPTFRSLYEAYERCATDKQREELLTGLQVRRDIATLSLLFFVVLFGLTLIISQQRRRRDGAPMGRVMGVGYSRRVYKQFCCRDPSAQMDRVE
jgi:hypothetical protein